MTLMFMGMQSLESTRAEGDNDKLS